MIKKAFLIIIFSFILISQPACTRKSYPFKDLTCRPPCWQGLTPGETTKMDLIDFLNNSPIIEMESFVEIGGNEIYRSRIAFDLISGTVGYAYFLNDTLTALYFFDDVEMNFNDAVELFGEPKFLLIYADFCNPSPRLSFGDALCSTIHAFNPEIGVEYGYQTKLSDHIKITPNTHLTNVGFFNPADYIKLVEGGAFYGFDHEKLLQYTRPWTGFGVVPEQ